MRYGLLETLLECAFDKLRDRRADLTTTRQHHANFYRAGGGDQPYALERSRTPKLVATSGPNGRHDQRSADAFEEGPADQQHPQVRGDRGRERSDALDDATNREGASSPDDGANLSAGEHQCRRQQRVERNGRLDPAHGGSQVAGSTHEPAVQVDLGSSPSLQTLQPVPKSAQYAQQICLPDRHVSGLWAATGRRLVGNANPPDKGQRRQAVLRLDCGPD